VRKASGKLGPYWSVHAPLGAEQGLPLDTTTLVYKYAPVYWPYFALSQANSDLPFFLMLSQDEDLPWPDH
jgi:hypothetical protein